MMRSAVGGVLSAVVALGFACAAELRGAEPKVTDLSLMVATDLPCAWPVGMTPFAIVHTHTLGLSPYHRTLVLIDEHTGTQWDAPAHFVPPPDSGLPGAGPNGLITGEKVPAWQFVGEACVIDITQHCDEASEGASYLIQPEIVKAWEKAHRPLRFGDAVLFRSDYSDRYYQPFPKGERFVATALRKETPAWPAPAPETMDYLASKGVKTLGLDGASMGPLPDLAVATHQAGGKQGMIWTECATNLKSLPETGAFFAMLPAKHAGGSGGECRCIGILDPQLAPRLIESARNKRVADLSVTLDDDLPITWPGHVPGEEATRYVGKTLNAFSKQRGPYFARGHVLDSQAGTHVSLPSFSLPPEHFDMKKYSPEIQSLLKKYEAKYGALGRNSQTLEQIPLGAMQGAAHVIDVRKLVGTTQAAERPRSPQITLDFVRQHEAAGKPIRAGEVVIFQTGHTDRHFSPLPAAPEVDPLFAAPLSGKTEGWPAPTPEVLAYLAEKGVKAVGTDGPTLGGVDREQALFVNWMAATRGLLVIEFLTGLEAIGGKEAYFIFAPIKIEGLRGGYGRAIALY